jgi:1-acyl-sn-glycerol-3-phosphate acyltransferase
LVDALLEFRILPWIYHFGKLLVGTLFRLFSRWRVTGKENVPRQGPLLVVANHLHAIDPPLLGVSLGRPVVFMAKEELFRSRLRGWFLSRLGSFPVRRGKLDRKAIRRSEQILADGQALMLFPEASRSENAQLQSALPGSALIASRHSVPVLPVGITGTEEVDRRGWIFRRPRITVNIGQPFYLPSPGSRLTKAELAEHTELIMRHIAELLPLEYRGVYGGESGED